MKTYRVLRFAAVTLAASLFLTTIPNSTAQGQGRGGRGGGFGVFQDMTDEQREAFQSLGEATRDLAMEQREAQVALSEAIFADKVDEAAIKEKAAAVAKLDLEYAIARAKAFAKVRGKFTSEQIDAFKRMGNFGGFGGRGFGGGARRGGRGAQ